jgi:hypothetical protein
MTTDLIEIYIDDCCGNCVNRSVDLTAEDEYERGGIRCEFRECFVQYHNWCKNHSRSE